ITSRLIWFITLLVFFFSSRRRHTRFSRDWSSDVCSSDLLQPRQRRGRAEAQVVAGRERLGRDAVEHDQVVLEERRVAGRERLGRSEERRVGEERGGSRWRSDGQKTDDSIDGNKSQQKADV